MSRLPVTALTHCNIDLATDLVGLSNTSDFDTLVRPSDFSLFDASVSHVSFMSSLDSASSLQVSDQRTISPKDIMNDMSAPPSGVTTDLSTPQTYTFESPGMVHSNETSPLFENEGLEGSDNWGSLFPTEDNQDTSPSLELFAPVMHRSQSSPGHHSRQSSLNAVRSRRKDKSLPKIDWANEADPISRKRKKNTEAARKSRAKKQERVEAMQERIDELEAEAAHFKAEASRSQAEAAHFKSLYLSSHRE